MANIQLADNLRRLRKQYNYTQAQIMAATCSPTPSPVLYHRPLRS